MKKTIKYTVIVIFVLNGVWGMSFRPEFSFWWWLNFISVFIWGGYLAAKLFNYLDK